MTLAHDLMVMAHRDPRERVNCVGCQTPIVAEDAFPYLGWYTINNEPMLGYVMFCTPLCCITVVPTEGQA